MALVGTGSGYQSDWAIRGAKQQLLVAGVAPYGWQGAREYTLGDVRPLPGGYTALSEQFGWEGFAKHDWGQANASQISNPPFIGVGSALVGNQVPEWMRGPHGEVKRILRGFIRHSGIASMRNPATNADYTGDEMRWALNYNARLFFMFNPAQIVRAYQAFGDTQNAFNPTDSDSAQHWVAPQMASISFSLFFDRQTEVMKYANHPGCLIDLQVFDAIAKGGSIGQRWFDGNTWQGGGPGDTSSVTSLMINSSLPITVVFSPNLAFEGNIMDAEATFEKFSHRMVPVHMTIKIGMLLTAITPVTPEMDKERDIVGEAKAAEAAAALAAQNATLPFGIQNVLRALNNAVAGNTVSVNNVVVWAAKQIGKQYNVGLRLFNMNLDTVDDASPMTAFDCSSLVGRAFRSQGYAAAVGFTGIPDTQNMMQIMQDPNKWEFKIPQEYIKKKGIQSASRTNAASDLDIKAWLRGGDVAVRAPGQLSGADVQSGHTVFIESRTDTTVTVVHATPPAVTRSTFGWSTFIPRYALFGRAKMANINPLTPRTGPS